MQLLVAVVVDRYHVFFCIQTSSFAAQSFQAQFVLTMISFYLNNVGFVCQDGHTQNDFKHSI